MNTTSTPLVPGCVYHIFNRGNNREDIFREVRNYHHFMKLWEKYIEPVANTFAYCLLRNHFHALIKMKDEEDLTGFKNLSGLGSRQFSNFFNAYAKAINTTYGRTGALFQRPFGRIPIQKDAHLFHLITYIHQNPQKHGFVKDFRNWPYSSFSMLTGNGPTHLRRDEVLSWFGGTSAMIKHHQETVPVSTIKEWVDNAD